MPESGIRAVVAYSPGPREVHEWTVRLPAGATIGQAVMASGLADVSPDFDPRASVAGVWGRKAPWEQALKDGDRVEVYRVLRVDPKVARRERFRKQGSRAAGLFARQRPGAKPGY